VVVREGDTVRVIVRCEACRHRWTVIMPRSRDDAAPDRL